MKIAIHHSKISFSERWISYCTEKQIPFKIVNCYESDIVRQLDDCDALLWHHYHMSQRDTLFAKQLLYSLEMAGKIVYPDFRTGWHFDDKLGQKYLLEAIDAPFVPSYVFYSKREAFDWIDQATFPKVFKLRKGSGSASVRLIKNRKDAIKIVNKAFRFGFRQYDPWGGLKERWRIVKLGHSNIRDLTEGIGRFFIKTRFERIVGREKGYVYFQDFIEGCMFDIRAKVVNNKCWAFKRLVRDNDFRASGSNKLVFSTKDIPLDVIRIAFDISTKLHLQSVAFDFVLSKNNEPFIIELSYGFGYDPGETYGYWDSELNWHEEEFDPFGEMIVNVVERLKLIAR